MTERFYSSGEAAQFLRVPSRNISYAITRGYAGRVLYVAGRAALSAANIRELARHFDRPIPPECVASEVKPVQIIQKGRAK